MPLLRKKRISFFELFPIASKEYIVATFLAILELCKTNSVTLEDDVSGENPNVRLIDESALTTQGDDENGTN